MKIFGERWRADETDGEQRALWAEYQALLAALPVPVGDCIRALQAKYPLHDALINRVIVEPRAMRLGLELVIGQKATGYQLLMLRYDGVAASDSSWATLKYAAESRLTSVVDDEFDLASSDPARFVHRIAFSPVERGEVELTFAHVEAGATPLTERCWTYAGHPFVDWLEEEIDEDC